MSEPDVTPFSSLCVVGGAGRMGQLFLDRATTLGLGTSSLDAPLTHEAAAKALAGADLVLLCVPAPAIPQVLDILTPHLAEGTVLADITSVKTTPLAQMVKRYTGPVVGTHPLFGPEPGPEESRVAITPAPETPESHVLAVEALFAAMGFAPFRTDAETHDKAMAAIQNLNFVTNAAYLAALAHQPGLMEFLTPSFKRRLVSAEKMLTTDAEMFATLFDENPHSQDLVRLYKRYLAVAAGGEVDLVADKARWWFEGGE